MVPEIVAHPVFGTLGARGWEWINLGALAGGLWLINQRVIQWQIPGSMLGALFLLATVFWLLDSAIHPSPGLEIMAGSAMFAHSLLPPTRCPRRPRRAAGLFTERVSVCWST